MTSRIYVGRKADKRITTPDLRSWVVFRSDEPSPEETPQIAYCVGPFRTRGGAAVFVEWSCAPSTVTVADCEREAKRREALHAIDEILGKPCQHNMRGGCPQCDVLAENSATQQYPVAESQFVKWTDLS